MDSHPAESSFSTHRIVSFFLCLTRLHHVIRLAVIWAATSHAGDKTQHEAKHRLQVGTELAPILLYTHQACYWCGARSPSKVQAYG
jgi:hypothetical protein